MSSAQDAKMALRELRVPHDARTSDTAMAAVIYSESVIGGFNALAGVVVSPDRRLIHVRLSPCLVASEWAPIERALEQMRIRSMVDGFGDYWAHDLQGLMLGQAKVGQSDSYRLPPGDRDGRGLADLFVASWFETKLLVGTNQIQDWFNLNDGKQPGVLSPEHPDVWKRIHQQAGKPGFSQGYYVVIERPHPRSGEAVPIAIVASSNKGNGCLIVCNSGDIHLGPLWEMVRLTNEGYLPGYEAQDPKAPFTQDWAKQIGRRLATAADLQAHQPRSIAFEGSLEGLKNVFSREVIQQDLKGLTLTTQSERSLG